MRVALDLSWLKRQARQFEDQLSPQDLINLWYAETEGYGDPEGMGATLYRWARNARRHPGYYAVELGCYKGQSLLPIALGTGLPLIAVDWGKGDAALGTAAHWDHATAAYWDTLETNVQRLNEMGLDVQLWRSDSAEAAGIWGGQGGRGVEFLFIDADHSYEGALEDFRAWSPWMPWGATVVWDDIWTSGVARAMDEARTLCRVIEEEDNGRMARWVIQPC